MVLGDVVALSSLPMSFDDGMIMEKKSKFPGKKSKTLETHINLLEKQSDPLVPWSSGPPVLWSPGPLVPWSSGPLVPGSS